MDLSQEIPTKAKADCKLTHTHKSPVVSGAKVGTLSQCREWLRETVWTTVTLSRSNNNMINRYVDDPLLPHSDTMHHLQ